MLSSQDSTGSPGKTKPITTLRVQDATEMSSPLDSYLITQKRKRVNSYNPEEEMFREMNLSEEQEKPKK